MIKIAPMVGKQRHRGAETVEFMLTLLLFLLVFFLIVDAAIALYNRGTIINASREGARQASLFWVDPLLFDPTTPELNQLLKRSMVDSVINWTESNLLIDQEAVGLTMTLRINTVEMVNPTQHVSSTDVASVDISYPHSYLVISTLSGVDGPSLASTTACSVE
ncbi:MAG: pilus assembly protein [Candidatus Thiodiazotropha sp. (ex Dulcina madagascariensis)]|nr:pilus assembly protein [Candidatus Thiodiazotropha sp. (ex Epidulcina cf. delphinae)]MCU7923758.1 pilus assembly protein [Candidatus Thiodiazotropha sp. (ex Dulcina madagascariensis)]MCU7925067.1 pilus assembly protein [Candidatus Thiodiazotropha sp. (ex Dulcina madagascariensis)]